MKLSVCLFISLLGIALLTGCASTPFSAAQKAGIHTLQLKPIDDSAEMRFGVDTTPKDDPFATASIDMMNTSGADGLRRMRKLMYLHHYDVPQMIQARVQTQLASQSNLVITDQPPADGTVSVKIIQYGYADMPFSLMHEIPFVMFKVELRDKSGKIIWSKKNEWSVPAEDDAGASWDEYEAHPDDLIAAWKTQIAAAVNTLLPNPEK